MPPWILSLIGVPSSSPAKIKKGNTAWRTSCIQAAESALISVGKLARENGGEAGNKPIISDLRKQPVVWASVAAARNLMQARCWAFRPAPPRVFLPSVSQTMR